MGENMKVKELMNELMKYNGDANVMGSVKGGIGTYKRVYWEHNAVWLE